jgi:CheY-like chemotaxis protein
MLTPLGFDLTEAADGVAALAKAQEVQPDLILIDLRMPGMSGFEVTQAIRGRADLNKITIIATSASVLDNARQHSLEAGCNDFLPKPIQAQHLFKLMETHLGLVWQYQTTPPYLITPESVKPDTRPMLTPPPAEEMTILLKMAAIGDMSGLRKKAAQLRTLDKTLTPFADKLEQLARTFQDKQILDLLHQYQEINRD